MIFQFLFVRLRLKERLKCCFYPGKGVPMCGMATIMMTLIVHILIGFRRLRDVEYYRDDPMVLRVLGLRRVPSVATFDLPPENESGKSVRIPRITGGCGHESQGVHGRTDHLQAKRGGTGPESGSDRSAGVQEDRGHGTDVLPLEAFGVGSRNTKFDGGTSNRCYNCMSRPLRIEYTDAVYHITARGNERREIFSDESDYEK